MKKMIVAALALIAINANAQVPAFAPTLSFTDHRFECDRGDGQLDENCLAAQRDMDLRRQYHLDEMTPAQRKLVQEMADQYLPESK